MKKTVYISGHRNPDSDSICSAIAYANYKNQIDEKNYIPIRLGELNNETKFILDYFKVEKPNFMETIKLKVSDWDLGEVAPLMDDLTIGEAQAYFKENEIDYSAVVNKRNHLTGVLTISTLNKVYSEASYTILNDSKTQLANVVKTLNGQVINESKKTKYFKGNIWVATMSEDSVEDFIKKDDIAIVGDREDIQEILIDMKVSLLIIAGGFDLNDDLLELAKEKDVTVIKTDLDSLKTAHTLPLSIPISFVMAKENLIYFNQDDLVDDVKKAVINNRYRAFPVIDDSKKVLGMISRYDLFAKDKKQIIMVDHNEYSQSIDGIESAKIIEVVDHHRIADIQSTNPIFLRNEPVGSTCTIVAKLYQENNVSISKEMAGLLMSGIISDTLLFKSPTCTKTDIEICEKLQKIAEVEDIHEYALEMQKKATSLKGLTAQDVFETDFKEFLIGNTKVGIAQFNTIDFKAFHKMKKEMMFLMESQLRFGDYDLLMLALTNIIDEGSNFIVAGDTKTFEKAFEKELDDNEVYIPGILSRKKQMVPVLSDYILEN